MRTGSQEQAFSLLNRTSGHGSYGEPLRRSFGVSFTRRELQALQRAARFGSTSKVVRTLIDRDKFEELIARTEAAAAQSSAN